MRRKAIFFDIDGTLCDEQNRIPDSAARAVAEMKAAGHAVLICSGRSRGYITDERLLSLGFDGIVSSAGAMVEIGGETIYCRLAPQDALIRAVRSARAYRYGPLLEGNSYLYMAREDFVPSPYIDKLYRELGERIRPLDGFFGQWDDVTKLSMIAYAEPHAERLTGELAADWDVIAHAPEILELTPPGVDKGTGLRRALNALGVRREDSVAFGDSANDLAMFRETGLGIAMGNAVPALAARADHVTAPLDEDGVWKAWQWLKSRA